MLFLVLDKDVSANWKLLFLFLWGVVIYLPFVLSSPDYLMNPDEMNHAQAMMLIEESGGLDIEPAFLVTKYYPGFELTVVSLKAVTNLPLLISGRLFIALFHSLTLVFVFLLVREALLSESIAGLGAYIFSTSPFYHSLDCMLSYESMGIGLIILIMFLIVSRGVSKTSNALPISILSILAISALVITHPFSSYMFLLFMACLTAIVVLRRIRARKAIAKEESYANLFLLSVSITLAWLIYVAAAWMMKFHYEMISGALKDVLAFSIFTGRGERELFWQIPMPQWEIPFQMLYFPLLLILSAAGIYLILRARRFWENIFIPALAIYGPLLLLLTMYTVLTEGTDFKRTWIFLSVGCALFAAAAINKLVQPSRKAVIKGGSLLLVILLLIGGISLGSSRIIPSSKYLAASSFAITPDVISACDWFQEQFGRDNIVTGDNLVPWVFGPYGFQRWDQDRVWELFFPEQMDRTALNYLESHRHVKWLVVDKRISELLAHSHTKSYFSFKPIYFEDYPAYGYTQPLPKESLQKFDDSDLFQKVYTGPNLSIYKVRLAPD